MDWGLISGSSALLGVLYNFVRLGEWKARQETKLDGLEKGRTVMTDGWKA